MALLAVAIPSSPSLAWNDEAENAYGRGDYATALKLWTPRAEQGETIAQLGIANMYRLGHGVPQSDSDFLKWYRMSDTKGSAKWWLEWSEQDQPHDLLFTSCDPKEDSSHQCISYVLSCERHRYRFSIHADPISYILAKRIAGLDIYKDRAVQFQIGSDHFSAWLSNLEMTPEDVYAEWHLTVDFHGDEIFERLALAQSPTTVRAIVADEEFSLTPQPEHWKTLFDFAQFCTRT